MKEKGYFFFGPLGPDGDELLFVVTKMRKSPKLVSEILKSCGASVPKGARKEIYSSLVPAEYGTEIAADGRTYYHICGNGFNFKEPIDKNKIMVLKLER